MSHVLIPTLYACSSSGRASSSFRTQSCQAGSPYDIAPRMTFETFTPDLPRLYQSSCQCPTLLKGDEGFNRGEEGRDLTYSILITLIGANNNCRIARVLGAVEERSTKVNDCSRMKDGDVFKPDNSQ